MINSIISASVLAGDYSLSQQYNILSTVVEYKSTDTGSLPDLVSYVDKQAEIIIQDHLKKDFPGIPFVGEETAKGDLPETCFLIDPIDGTTNYLSGSDYYCVSAAYIENGEIIHGVVYQPSTKALYHASHKEGAYKGDRKIPLYQSAIAKPMLVMEEDFGGIDTDKHVQRMKDVAKEGISGFRKFGSTALDICRISEGYAAMLIASKLKPWDIAAALLIGSESGLEIQDHTGNKATHRSSSIFVLKR